MKSHRTREMKTLKLFRTHLLVMEGSAMPVHNYSKQLQMVIHFGAGLDLQLHMSGSSEMNHFPENPFSCICAGQFCRYCLTGGRMLIG